MTKAWSAHQTFGLRTAWLQLVLKHPDDWEDAGDLGSRQVLGLRTWLKTAGLRDVKDKKTALWLRFLEWGVEDRAAWEMLWANVVFNFPTAAFYVRLSRQDGPWTTTRLVHMLAPYGPSQATRRNAVLELAGLLERTPVGGLLGQGRVSPGRPRSIQRSGLARPCPEALGHCLLLLKETVGDGPEVQNVLLDSEKDTDILWPWIVFGCERREALRLLASSGIASFAELGLTVPIDWHY